VRKEKETRKQREEGSTQRGRQHLGHRQPASSSIAKTVSEDDGGGVFGGGVDGEKGKRGHACGYAGWGKVRMMKGLVEDGVVGCEDENKGWDENEETVLGEHYDGQEGCRV
jgi:hypothetical protein